MPTISALIIGCVKDKDIDELKNLLKDNRCTLKILIYILEWFNNRDFNYKQSREKIRKIINEKILQFQQDEKFSKSKLKMEQEKYKEIECALSTLGITVNYIKHLCKDDIMELIKAQHRAMRLAHHPDKGGDNEKFREIEDAWSEIQQFFHSHKIFDKHVLKF
tara:strand:+ start:540 stop:1028 length:489 start_codon:yes stop_codon:yes gene_type:complete